jgi:flagellar hook-associated protein 3 FlgL
LKKTLSQEIEISKGVNIDLSAGQMTFHKNSDGNPEINSAFITLGQLRKSLMDGEQIEAGNLIGKIDSLIDNVISERAVVGAKSNRIEQAKDRAESFNASINTLISILEDTDYAEASALYKTQQAVYEASLTVGANIIQPSLLDFLR